MVFLFPFLSNLLKGVSQSWWNFQYYIISPFISAIKLKNIHSEFMNNLEGDSITANHRDNLPVLYKYGAMLFCCELVIYVCTGLSPFERAIFFVFNFSIC